MPESIIIYRNPMEAAMWEPLMSTEGFTIFISVVVLGTIACIIYGMIVNRINRRGRRR